MKTEEMNEECLRRLVRRNVSSEGGEAERGGKAQTIYWIKSGSGPYFVCTQKCRFMDKEVREISPFFVAPPRGFPLSIWRVSRTSLSTITSTLVLSKIISLEKNFRWRRRLISARVKDKYDENIENPLQIGERHCGAALGRGDMKAVKERLFLFLLRHRILFIDAAQLPNRN